MIRIHTPALLSTLSLIFCASQCGNSVHTGHAALSETLDEDKKMSVKVTYQMQCDKDHQEANGVHTVDNGSKVKIIAKFEGDEKAKEAVQIEWTCQGATSHTSIKSSDTAWECEGQPNDEITITGKAVCKPNISDDEKPQIEDPGYTSKLRWKRVNHKENAIKAIREAFEDKQLVFSVERPEDIVLENGSARPAKKARITFKALKITNQSDKVLSLQYLQEALDMHVGASVHTNRNNKKVYKTNKAYIPSLKDTSLQPRGSTNLQEIALEFDRNELEISKTKNQYHIYWFVRSDSYLDLFNPDNLGECAAPTGKKWYVDPSRGGTIALEAESTKVVSVSTGIYWKERKANFK